MIHYCLGKILDMCVNNTTIYFGVICFQYYQRLIKIYEFIIIEVQYHQAFFLTITLFNNHLNIKVFFSLFKVFDLLTL